MEETLNKLREVAELQKAATPGPWEYVIKGNTVQSLAIAGVCSGISPKTKNAAFIAGARSLDLADVVRVVESLQQSEQKASAEVTTLRSELASAQGEALGVFLALSQLSSNDVTPEWRAKMLAIYKEKGGQHAA